MKDSVNYHSLLVEKNYLKLFIANVISRFGDSLDAIAYSWMVYEITHSPTWIAIIFGINALPSILFQPLCGVLVERMNKKLILFITDLGRAMTVFLTALLLITGHLTPWFLMLFTFINSSFEAFRIPAGLAIFPQVLPKEKYSYGTGLSASVNNIVQLVGTATAGMIIGLLGTGGAIIIDALTFLISGFILITLKLSPSISTNTVLTVKSFFLDLKEGFTYLKNKKIVFAICFVASIINVLIVPFNTMQAVYVSEFLHLDANGLSIIGIALTLGMALGSYIFPFIIKKHSSFSTFVTSGILFSSTYVLLALLPHISNQWLLLAGLALVMLIFGGGASLVIAVVQVAFMTHVDESYLARCGSIMNAMGMALIPIGSFTISFFTAFLNVTQLFLISGVSCILFFILCLFNNYLKQL
ncbi:MAG: MFS transporter [Cellulosilyticaceae bacterium]